MKNKAATFSPGGWREANFQLRRNYSTLPLHRAYLLTKSPPPPWGTASSTGNPPLAPEDETMRQKRWVITSVWLQERLTLTSGEGQRSSIIVCQSALGNVHILVSLEQLMQPCVHLPAPPPPVKTLPTPSHTHCCTATLLFHQPCTPTIPSLVHSVFPADNLKFCCRIWGLTDEHERGCVTSSLKMHFYGSL